MDIEVDEGRGNEARYEEEEDNGQARGILASAGPSGSALRMRHPARYGFRESSRGRDFDHNGAIVALFRSPVHQEKEAGP